MTARWLLRSTVATPRRLSWKSNMWARTSLWTVSGLMALGLANGHAGDLEHRASPTYIVAAVADPARPATDTSRYAGPLAGISSAT
jgi:hypothetical protein